MTQEIINQFVPIILTMVSGVITYIGIVIKNKIAEKIDNETKKSLVQTTVKYIEQVFYDLEGPKKFEEAITQVELLFKEHGIKVGSVELKMLIEEAVNNIKNSK